LTPLVGRVAALETRLNVCVEAGPDITLKADPDQLEQMLINLIRNAADSVLTVASVGETGRERNHAIKNGVMVRWHANSEDVTLEIEDEGAGLLNPSNLFTPFYTTKPRGSGVGLVLCRQIAEAHEGTIEINNRSVGSGFFVRVMLPIHPTTPT